MQMEANDCEEGEHKFTLDNYHVLEQVRRGKSTSDFVVLHEIEDKKYAMKKISLAKHTEKLKLIACQEMNSLSKLKNPYIVEYEDSWIDKDNYACIFTACYEGANMANAIKKARGKLFPEEKIFKWLVQLLLAVNYLHSNRVLHLDLTCSNIFLPKDDHIQLGNYGLAKLINPEKPASLVPGIANSMSPEVLEDQPYGYKSDIWSLGCCMYEITAHQPAFKAPDKAGLINKINRSLLSPLPIVYSSTLKQMIKLMLRKKPEHRPTACELLRNPCLQPYLLQCQNLSPIYLPVFPINSPKDKRRSSLPGKFVKEREEREKSEVSRSLENLYPFWTKAETGSSSSSQPASSTNGTDDKPETKRIDPSCDTLKISESTSHKSNPEIAFYTTEKQNEEIDLLNETENMFSGESQLPDVDFGIVNAQGLCCPPSTIEEAEAQEAIPEPMDQTKLSISSSEVVAESECLSGNVEVDEAKTVKLTASEMSSVLSKLTKLGPPQSKERADALECLLEKCAGLVKQEKYEELAGLLTPFGEDGVSARDTAIWFAKTLLSSDKLNQGTD